ncbi:MAG TPA: hypothetical protein PLA39_01110 [Methanoculleus sp.]|nr:hypothetical protein [Methanoculleus sp.]
MPLVDDFEDTLIHSIGHLGIVAGAYASRQNADVFDAALRRPVITISATPRFSRPWFSTVSDS